MRYGLWIGAIGAVAQACTCMWMGPLLTVAPRAEVVVRGRVLSYHGQKRGVDLAMDVAVVETIQGRLRASKIRIWGDNGSQCRPYVKAFEIGTEWILAISRLSSAPGDYFINGCGEFWAKVEGPEVTGLLTVPAQPTDKPQRMSLDELRKRLRAANAALAAPAERD